jgi:hypothetical protein
MRMRRMRSRGIVIVDTAPGRQDTHAVCMIRPAAIAAALRSTSAWPVAESFASGTRKPNVFGSQMPVNLTAVPGAGEGAAAGAARAGAASQRSVSVHMMCARQPPPETYAVAARYVRRVNVLLQPWPRR